jgi:hypothetical protein
MLTITCVLFFSSVAFAGQELSMLNEAFCDSATSSWTPWFNTQNPTNNNGNDIEDWAVIREQYQEAAHCDVALHVEYSALKSANDEAIVYRTLINKNGIFCMGTRQAPCPDYSVRFCCPISRQAQ